jgi:SAM-dependent methyltransferase
VLDVACGEGYGSALLSQLAVHVTGVDIAEDAVAHARASYAARPTFASSAVRPRRCRWPMRRSTSRCRSRRSSIWPAPINRGCSPKLRVC